MLGNATEACVSAVADRAADAGRAIGWCGCFFMLPRAPNEVFGDARAGVLLAVRLLEKNKDTLSGYCTLSFPDILSDSLPADCALPFPNASPSQVAAFASPFSREPARLLCLSSREVLVQKGSHGLLALPRDLVPVSLQQAEVQGRTPPLLEGARALLAQRGGRRRVVAAVRHEERHRAQLIDGRAPAAQRGGGLQQLGHQPAAPHDGTSDEAWPRPPTQQRRPGDRGALPASRTRDTGEIQRMRTRWPLPGVRVAGAHEKPSR